MLWVDILIISIIALSAIISLIRGFMQEAVSLATWIAAFALAWFFFRPLAVELEPWIDVPSIRLGVAYGIILLLVLVVGVLVGPLIYTVDPDYIDFAVKDLPPTPGLHPFGTDNLGRDTLARNLHGGRISIAVGSSSSSHSSYCTPRCRTGRERSSRKGWNGKHSLRKSRSAIEQRSI